MVPLERNPQTDDVIHVHMWCKFKRTLIDIKMWINTEATKFGLSILHARIRILKSILYLEKINKLKKVGKCKFKQDFGRKLVCWWDMPKYYFVNTNEQR